MAIRSKATTVVIDKGFDSVVAGILRHGRFPHAKIGFPAGSGKADAVHSDSKLTVREIALIHEFGAPAANIPERSHIRSSYDENVQKNVAFMTSLLSQMLASKNVNIKRVLLIMSERMIAQHKNKIRSNIPPRLKTREGTALIDTAQMINSITSQLVTGPPLPFKSLKGRVK